MIINVSIQQEDKTFVNIYVSNLGAPKYRKQMLIDLMGEIESKIIIVRNCNTPFVLMDKSSKRKIKK